MKNKTRAFLLNLTLTAVCILIFLLIPTSQFKFFIGRLPRHIIGMIGFLLFLVPLNHTTLKRYMMNRDNAGISLSKLQNLHIYGGCSGFILVLIHTEFNYRGFPGVTFYALSLTVLTGLLGKFFFTRIPKNIRGEELTQEELRHINHSITSTLVSLVGKECSDFDLTPQKIREMANYISAIRSDDVRGGWTRAMWLLVYEDMLSFFRTRKIRARIVDEIPVGWGAKDVIMELIVKKSIVMRNIHFYKSLNRIGKYWRNTHKFLQKLTLGLIIFHTIVGIIFFVP